MPDLVSMNRIPLMFLSHPKHGVKLLPYFRKDVVLTLFPFPPYHEFRDGRFHTDEGSHFATVDVMDNRKRAIIVTMGDKQEVLADTSADLYRMVRGCLIRQMYNKHKESGLYSWALLFQVGSILQGIVQ